MRDLPLRTEGFPSLSNAHTLRDAVRALTKEFRGAGLETPDLDARRLVLETLSLDSTALLREPDRWLTSAEQHHLAKVKARRLAREPVSRILGSRAFHGLEFEIGPSTLDPRPDTETLVDGVLQLVADGRIPGGDAPRILDVGTGSGAILVALLHELPRATGLGTDISEEALAIAERNAARYGLSERATFRKTSWLDDLDGTFDLIVSNPPYIPTDSLAGLEPEVATFDPITALDGGTDGLAGYRAIARGLKRRLAPGGWVAVEVGIGQCSDVTYILGHGLDYGSDSVADHALIWIDLGDIARCVALEARG